MNRFKLVLLSIVALFLFSFSSDQNTFKEEELIAPDILAKILQDEKSVKPLIVNVGPMADIKYAFNINTITSGDGIDIFNRFMSKYSKDKEVIVYCGCCKLVDCPNVKTAREQLLKNGYKKYKILNLPIELPADWTSKGYPMK